MIEVSDVCFSYGEEGVLDHVSLCVGAGERVVLLGPNGSGKSTLVRLINGSIAPSEGSVLVDGCPEGLSHLVGYVRQDPRNQIVSSLVSDEVAFGPRNLGLPREEVLRRVDEALEACGICELRSRATTELSGGQQQLVAIAGVLAMRPRYLVLDEVGAHLDAAARRRVSDVVERLLARGVGVLEVTHDPLALFGAARAAVLAAGRVAWQGTPRELFLSDEALALAGLGEDFSARLLGVAVRRGLSVGSRPDPRALASHLRRGDVCSSGQPRAKALFRPYSTSRMVFARGSHFSLRDVSLDLGGVTLVLGPSGSGKTTLARLLAGVLEPDAGEVLLDGRPVRAGRVGLSFQRPGDQLFCDTVFDDIAYGPRARGLSERRVDMAVRAAAHDLDVGERLFDRSPFDLSGGQMRRVALAGVIACEPGAYVFDEPTAGLDGPSRAEFRHLIRRLAAGGSPVVVVTHDAGEWLDEVTSVVLLRDGAVIQQVEASVAGSSPELFWAAGLEAPLIVSLRSELRARGEDA